MPRPRYRSLRSVAQLLIDEGKDLSENGGLMHEWDPREGRIRMIAGQAVADCGRVLMLDVRMQEMRKVQKHVKRNIRKLLTALEKPEEKE